MPPEGINRRFSQSRPTPRPRQAGTNPTTINLALRISGKQPQSGNRQILRILAEHGNKPYGRWPKSPAPPPAPAGIRPSADRLQPDFASHAQRDSPNRTTGIPAPPPYPPQQQESTAGPDTGKIATLNNPDTADTDAPADALNK